jgi:hypothetical protein
MSSKKMIPNEKEARKCEFLASFVRDQGLEPWTH